MKKNLIIIAVFMFLGSVTVVADQNTESSTSFRPCSSWRYNSDLSGYSCSFLGPYITVKSEYDYSSLERQVSDLQRELRYLENRVRMLESSK